MNEISDIFMYGLDLFSETFDNTAHIMKRHQPFIGVFEVRYLDDKFEHYVVVDFETEFDFDDKQRYANHVKKLYDRFEDIKEYYRC